MDETIQKTESEQPQKTKGPVRRFLARVGLGGRQNAEEAKPELDTQERVDQIFDQTYGRATQVLLSPSTPPEARAAYDSFIQRRKGGMFASLRPKRPPMDSNPK